MGRDTWVAPSAQVGCQVGKWSWEVYRLKGRPRLSSSSTLNSC